MTASPPPRSTRTPRPLAVAAGLTALEAVVFLVLSVFQIPGMQGAKLVMNVTTFAFFVAYAVFLLLCARELLRLHSWARAPVVLAQVFQVVVGVDFWGGRTSVVAVLAVTVALVTLVALFHPASVRALAGER